MATLYEYTDLGAQVPSGTVQDSSIRNWKYQYTTTALNEKLQFNHGVATLEFKGQKLPVHVDTLMYSSRLVADVSKECTNFEDMVIKVPDSLDPHSLDKYLCKAYGRHSTTVRTGIFTYWNYYSVIDFFQAEKELVGYDEDLKKMVVNHPKPFLKQDQQLLDLFVDLDFKADVFPKSHLAFLNRLMGWMLEDKDFAFFALSSRAMTSLRPETLRKMMGASLAVLWNVHEPTVFKKKRKTLDKDAHAERIEDIGKSVHDGIHYSRYHVPTFLPRFIRQTVCLERVIDTCSWTDDNKYLLCVKTDQYEATLSIEATMYGGDDDPVIHTLAFEICSSWTGEKEPNGSVFFTGTVEYTAVGGDQKRVLHFQRANKLGFEDDRIDASKDVTIDGEVDVVIC